MPHCQGKRLKKEGKSLKRLPRSGGQNKKRTLEFMANISAIIAYTIT